MSNIAAGDPSLAPSGFISDRRILAVGEPGSGLDQWLGGFQISQFLACLTLFHVAACSPASWHPTDGMCYLL